VHLGGASSPATFRILLRKAYHGRWSRLYMMGAYIGPVQRVLGALKTLVAAPLALLIFGLLLQKQQWMSFSEDDCTS
jgi:hypothetical protein